MTEMNLRARGRSLGAALRANGGRIAYCAGVALALTAIAFGAEAYRSRREERPVAPALPAVEFSRPEAEDEADAVPCAPEGAQLLRGYSAAPVWNAALGLWESHEGTDYLLKGGAVASLSGGTVRTVGYSGVFGGFVEVECGELLLRYASISPREGLAPGDALRPGDLLGAADASMPGESGLGAHLHLEALRGGRCVDFETLACGD